MLTIIIPVLSESISAKRCIEAALASGDSSTEIIVVDGGISGLATQLVALTDEYRGRVRTIRCTENRRLWTLMRLGVGAAHGDKVLFAEVEEWLEKNGAEQGEQTMNALAVDAVQFRKIKRIKHIAKREGARVLDNATARGADLREILSMDDEERLVSASFSDKIYRTDLLREALKHDFCGSWGTGEILNLHYFRYARSIGFSDIAIADFHWTDAEPAASYSLLRDIRKVYEVKLLLNPEGRAGIERELRRHLFRYVSDLMFKLGWTREATCYYLRDELSNKFWESAGIDESIDEMVEEAVRSNKRLSWKKLAKYFVG